MRTSCERKSWGLKLKTNPELQQAALTEAEKENCLQLVEDIQQERTSDLSQVKEIPHVLLPYQAAWHEDKTKIRIAEKSRRIGFSWGSLASEAVLESSMTKDNGGMNQFYMGYNLRMAAEFIGDCAFFARAFGHAVSSIDVSKQVLLIEDERRDIVTYKITFTSGHRIEALSSNPHNWRGQQGHARIDEAAFHPQLEELIKGALAFLMWGGRLSIVSTHNGEDNTFNALIKDVEAGKLKGWSHHKYTFDDALKAGFYKRVCLIQGKEWSQEAEDQYREETFNQYPAQEDANEELMCIAKRGTGAFFSRMLIENCWQDGILTLRFAKPAEFVLDPDREKVTDDWLKDVLKPVIDNMPGQRTVYGQDFGRDGDLSVIWILQQEADLLWRTAFLLELRTIPFDIQRQITSYILTNIPLFFHAKFDARGNGQSHAEAALQDHYGKVECVKATAAWYETWFPKYRAAYEDKNIIVPKSEDIVADHRSIQLVNGRPTVSDKRFKGEDGKFRHADSAIAGLLAWAATCEEGEPAAGANAEKDENVYKPKAMADRLLNRLKRERLFG